MLQNLHCRKNRSRSSFEQTLMGWSPQCYIPSFVEIGPLVPEKKTFDGFLPYMDMVNPRSSFEQTMMYPGHKCYIRSFVEIGPLVPEKILKGLWRPSWPCDQHHINKFSFPCTSKLTYKI